MRRFMVAGNWKMNNNRAGSAALAAAVARAVPRDEPRCEVVVCPAFPYLIAVGDAIAGSGVLLGAQNAYHEKPGAFTGEVALEMLADLGCRYVIVGHSERRHVLGESDEAINLKLHAMVNRSPLDAVFCVGETLDERQSGRTEEVLDRQIERGLQGIDTAAMRRIVIAYEPVWAIGTGHVATPEQAESAHAHLRKRLAGRYNAETAEGVRILYGGSVKPDNAGELLAQPDVDGALVGGASLQAETFLPIVEAAIRQAG